MSYTIGIDIGGTKIAAALIDRDKNIICRAELPSDPTDSEKMYQQVLNCVDTLFTESNVSLGSVAGIGVGVPGKVDRKNGIAIYQNNLPWRDFPLSERLKDAYQIEHVVVDNDVYMATFSEWVHHGAMKQETFVYLTISTGISCAIIHHGQFLRGAGFAGEIGLVPFYNNNEKKIFRRVESLASGPALQQAVQDKNLSTKEIFEHCQLGDETVIPVIDNMTSTLAYACYLIGCLLDPNKFVFGGGVMNNQPFLLDMIKEKMKQYMIEEQKYLTQHMCLSKSKGDAGIIGAGLSAFNENIID